MTIENTAASPHWETFVEVALRAHRKRCCCHARELRHLIPECADRVLFGAEALLERYATMKEPIRRSIVAWAVAALPNAEVDKYRRERGNRGALQRDRVPLGLQRALDDPRLVEIARRMIDFVGTPHAIGGGVWPTGAWSADHQLAQLGGGPAVYDERACERDIAHVLGVMEAWNPTWLDQRILVPLSRQAIPVANRENVDAADGPATVDDREAELRDRLLLDAAADLLDALAARLAVGDRAPAEVVREVLDAFTRVSGVQLTDAAVATILEIVGS